VMVLGHWRLGATVLGRGLLYVCVGILLGPKQVQVRDCAALKDRRTVLAHICSVGWVRSCSSLSGKAQPESLLHYAVSSSDG
jgi:hypothetical protein